MRKPLVALLTLASLTVTVTACGGDDDVFPRDEYVRLVTEEGVTKPVAECAYDSFKDDKKIMAELIRTDGPNDNVSDAVAADMSNALARCIIAAEDAKNPPKTTTTSKPRSTTTVKPNATTTTTKRRGA